MKQLKETSLIIAALVCFAVSARADVIAIDEHGNGVGTLGPGFLAPDPGPGGLPLVLTYLLPFAGVQGDVLLFDPAIGTFLDVLRFNGNGTVLFYSDNIDGVDAIGDTVSPPGAFYANTITINEVGPEGANGAFYTPGPGQPGFDPAAAHSFSFVSDGTVPEPSAVVLLATVFMLLAVVIHRRVSRAT
jgi:hypothetical protein